MGAEQPRERTNRAQVSVMHTRVAVNLGDHAQDITSAVAPGEGETVEDFANRILNEGFPSHLPVFEDFLVIRLIRPARTIR